MEKRGTIALEEIVFFVLNAAFFVIMLIFIVNSTTGRAVYEQAYAKQIAFMIDESSPGMTIFLDMEKAIKLAGKKTDDPNIKNLVTIDNSARKVTVKLGNTGGRSFTYFSNVKVSKEFNGIYLKLTIDKNV